MPGWACGGMVQRRLSFCSTPNQQIDTETGTDGFSFLYLALISASHFVLHAPSGSRLRLDWVTVTCGSDE